MRATLGEDYGHFRLRKWAGAARAPLLLLVAASVSRVHAQAGQPASPSPSPQAAEEDSPSSHHLSGWQIALIIGLVLGFAILVVSGFVLWLWLDTAKYERFQNQARDTPEGSEDGGAVAVNTGGAVARVAEWCGLGTAAVPPPSLQLGGGHADVEQGGGGGVSERAQQQEQLEEAAQGGPEAAAAAAAMPAAAPARPPLTPTQRLRMLLASEGGAARQQEQQQLAQRTPSAPNTAAAWPFAALFRGSGAGSGGGRAAKPVVDAPGPVAEAAPARAAEAGKGGASPLTMPVPGMAGGAVAPASAGLLFGGPMTPDTSSLFFSNALAVANDDDEFSPVPTILPSAAAAAALAAADGGGGGGGSSDHAVPAAQAVPAHQELMLANMAFTTATNSVFMPQSRRQGRRGLTTSAVPHAVAQDGDGESSGYESFRAGAATEGTAASNTTLPRGSAPLAAEQQAQGRLQQQGKEQGGQEQHDAVLKGDEAAASGMDGGRPAGGDWWWEGQEEGLSPGGDPNLAAPFLPLPPCVP